MADNESNEDLIKGLTDTVAKLQSELEALKARVETLESDGASPPASPATKSKQIKTKSKKKNTKKKTDKKKAAKKEKITDQGEKKGRVKQNKKTNFYHVVAKKMYVDVPEPFEFGKKHKVPPAKILDLNYAYGYNGQIHGNLISDRDGAELVYCLAGVVVVQNVADNTSQKFFRGHNEDVICLAKNPTASIFASGQRDPKDDVAGEYTTPYVCVWENGDDGVRELARFHSCFERAVVAVGWTFDGNYLFAVGNDDSHTGYLWNTSKACALDKGAKMIKKSKPACTTMVSKDEVYGQVHAPKMYNDKYTWLTFGLKVVKVWYSDGKTIESNVLGSFQQTKITQKSYYCAAFTNDLDIIVGCHTGHIYHFEKENRKLVKWFDCGKNPIISLSCNMEDGSYTAMDKKGKVYNYDSSHKSTDEEEAASVFETGKHGEATVLVTSGGNKYIGTRKNKIVSIGDDGECKVMMAGHTKEIWALACHPKEPWVCVGCDDKSMRVWDFNTKTIIFEKRTKHGFRTADFSREGNLLAVGCTDGTVCVFDCANDFALEEVKGVAKEEVSAIAFSADGKKIFVGSWDQMLYLLKKKKDVWKRDGKPFKGHTSSITHLTMSVDGKYAQSCSKDIELLYWDMETGKRTDDVPVDLVWDRWNAIFGWPVQGLFFQAGDATDVNCCEISGGNENDDEGGNKMVASGDDTGHVTVFKYPILEQKPKHYDQYLAHSAHVTNVRWDEEDKYLFSVGGGDLACFQWSVVDRS